MAEAGPRRILAVLDVNVFVDVAQVVGEPYNVGAWDAVLTACSADPIPHPTNARLDSVRALARLRTGGFADGSMVEVWTSDHIDLLTARKLVQPMDAGDPRDRGLGWERSAAQRFIDEVIGDVTGRTGGGSVGPLEIAHCSPPLEHEDGIVLNTARTAGHKGAFYDERYCLTRDRQFRDVGAVGEVDVLRPHEWVHKHNAVARAVGMKNLLGGR